MERDELAKAIFDRTHLTGEFTLRSGVVSNEYFDKYLFESDPVLLRTIVDALVPLLPPDTEALAGLELGGVPIATALSQVTGLPALFVRKEAKTYGTCRLAEGGDIDGRRLTVVEDVVTSGGQVVASCGDLRERGGIVTHAVCVIDRQSGGPGNLTKIGVELRALYTMDELEGAGARKASASEPSWRGGGGFDLPVSPQAPAAAVGNAAVAADRRRRRFSSPASLATVACGAGRSRWADSRR